MLAASCLPLAERAGYFLPFTYLSNQAKSHSILAMRLERIVRLKAIDGRCIVEQQSWHLGDDQFGVKFGTSFWCW